jgi:hypothetical protein
VTRTHPKQAAGQSSCLTDALQPQAHVGMTKLPPCTRQMLYDARRVRCRGATRSRRSPQHKPRKHARSPPNQRANQPSAVSACHPQALVFQTKIAFISIKLQSAEKVGFFVRLSISNPASQKKSCQMPFFLDKSKDKGVQLLHMFTFLGVRGRRGCACACVCACACATNNETK